MPDPLSAAQAATDPTPQQIPSGQPAPFKMMPVVSSTLQLVGYDPRAEQLHVQFKSGPYTYIHDEVPPQMFTGLLNAKSKGLFYANEIKGKFKYTKQKPIPPQL